MYFSAAAAFLIMYGQTSAQDTAKAKTEFKPGGRFSGQVFGDFQYKASAPDSTNLRTFGSKAQYAFANGYDVHYYSFDLRRVYLGYDYDFSEKFSAQLLLSHEGNNYDAQGNRTVLIKAANVRWKGIFKGADLVFGQQATPIFTSNSEPVWGYRSVEKTIADMRGIASSNDFGVGLQGKYKDGKMGYNFLIANNNSAKPENDTYKKFYGDVWTKLMDKKLILDFNSDYEITQLTPSGGGYKHSLHSKTTIKGFAAYQTKQFTVGVEVFSANWINFAYVKDTAKVSPDGKKTDTVNVRPFGVSLFAKATIIKEKLGVFARYDMYNPDNNYSAARKYSGTNSHISESFMTFGIDYTPIANVHIMPNIWINSYKENADIKNNNLYPNKGKGQQASGSDIDYRITMFWKF